MKIADVNNLLFNPLWTSKLMHHFLSGACISKSNRIKFELVYFALPFLYDEAIKPKLATSKTTSSLYSVFRNASARNCTVNKSNQIEAFREITNIALITLGNQISIQIDQFVRIDTIVSYKDEEIKKIRDNLKAAFNWGLILAKEDYRNVFLQLGVLYL